MLSQLSYIPTKRTCLYSQHLRRVSTSQPVEGHVFAARTDGTLANPLLFLVFDLCPVGFLLRNELGEQGKCTCCR